jgi:hypothetical protein
VQQAADGRLYVEASNGTPMFLDPITLRYMWRLSQRHVWSAAQPSRA